jgi:hypothetical protein
VVSWTLYTVAISSIITPATCYMNALSSAHHTIHFLSRLIYATSSPVASTSYHQLRFLQELYSYSTGNKKLQLQLQLHALHLRTTLASQVKSSHHTTPHHTTNKPSNQLGCKMSHHFHIHHIHTYPQLPFTTLPSLKTKPNPLTTCLALKRNIVSNSTSNLT